MHAWQYTGLEKKKSYWFCCMGKDLIHVTQGQKKKNRNWQSLMFLLPPPFFAVLLPWMFCFVFKSLMGNRSSGWWQHLTKCQFEAKSSGVPGMSFFKICHEEKDLRREQPISRKTGEQWGTPPCLACTEKVALLRSMQSSREMRKITGSPILFNH